MKTGKTLNTWNFEHVISVCQSENGKTGLAVDRDGFLWRGTNKETIWHWEQYDFNAEYQGYYPPCRFTAVAWTESGFLAVGMEEHGMEERMGKCYPVAYSSLRGGVWQPENLSAVTPEGILTPTEPIYNICPDKTSGQIFLFGGKGQIITLNGCPKCVKISYFTDQDIKKGEIQANEMLHLTLADGTMADFPLSAALQLRLSKEAAEKKQQQGGLLIYVGEGEKGASGEDFVGGFRENSAVLVCPLPKLGVFLRSCPKEQTLVFFCESGVKAEAAAKSARAEGFPQAYFIGRNG